MIRGILEADYHCGHVLGLTPPDYAQKNTTSLTSPVWEWREAELRQIGQVDVHLMLGDLTDGPGKKSTLGLYTTDTGDQADIAEECARRVRAKWRAICYGTPYHSAGTASYEKQIAKALGCEIREAVRVKLNGLRFHCRHVVGRSDIPYGQGTQIAKEWVRDELRGLIENYQAADVFCRAHVHYFWHEESAKKHAIVCPTYQLPNPEKEDGNVYARGLRTMYYDVGMVYFEIDRHGELFIRKRIMPMKMAIRREYLCPIKDES